jgi:hypothetical protein
MRNLVVRLLAGSGSAILGVGAIVSVLLMLVEHQPLIFRVERALALGLFASILTFVAQIVWALPLHWLFTNRGITSVYAYLTAGAVAGPFFLVVFRPFGQDPYLKLLLQEGILGGFGAVAALLFWLVVVKPQRQAGG